MLPGSGGTLLGKEEVNLAISSYQRPDPKSLPASAKLIGNYTNSILAGHEARQKGADEALMLDTEGNITKATHTVSVEQTDGSNKFVDTDIALDDSRLPAKAIVYGVFNSGLARAYPEQAVADAGGCSGLC